MTTLPPPAAPTTAHRSDPGDRSVPAAATADGSTASLAAAFLAAAARNPDAPAVMAVDGHVSYRELADRASHISEQITARVADTAIADTAFADTAFADTAFADTALTVAGTAGTGTDATGSMGVHRKDTTVGLLCRHGATTISAMVGAVLAGVTYVPLDPNFPVDRLRRLAADSGALLILTDNDHEATASEIADTAAVMNLDPVLAAADNRSWNRDVDVAAATAADFTAEEGSPASSPVPPTTSPAATYLLYTSGSTGVPKGVRQRDSGVLFAAEGHRRRYDITPADRVSVLSSFGFDMSVTDTYAALLAGAAVVPIDVRALGLSRTTELLATHRVTILHSTPSVFRYLTAGLGRHALPYLRVVLLGGEEVTGRDVRICRERIGPDCTFVNGYGTTECSFIAQHPVPPGAPVPDGIVPVGRPLEGIEVLLLGPDGQPRPDHGEILVRSPHVALGYHGPGGNTEKRFGVSDRVPTYRTGDLATWLPDGTLLFTGRADRQVKIRGHRVELGDVESTLADLPGVSQAAVVARRGVDDGLELVGYVVPQAPADTRPAGSDLRAALTRVLPDYMIPRAVVTVAQMPLTATGKLDERALPEPEAADRPADITGAAGAAAAAAPDRIEGMVARVWCEVLEVDTVDPEATFFEIGGHSLLMALMQQRLETVFGRRIPMATLFSFPTVRGLAAELRPTDTATGTANRAAHDRVARRRAARRGRES